MIYQKQALTDIKFHPHSFGDQNIRLFHLDGQIYRGIRGEAAVFFGRLFQEGVIQSLVEKGLMIDSELVTLKVENYDLVVRHRALPFNAYPNEWCAAMLKDAIILMLDLAIALASQGLTLIDAHPWNLMFDMENNRPIFVDLGSIIPIHSASWPAYDEFCRFCLNPLILMLHGYDEMARLLMFEERGVTHSDVAKLVGGRFQKTWIRSLTARLSRSLTRFTSTYGAKFGQDMGKLHLRFLENLKEEIEGIDINPKSSAYLPQSSCDGTQATVHQILTDLKPDSVLDVSPHQVWQIGMAARLGSQVLSFDGDRDRTTHLYDLACTQKWPILPLVMDFTKSTPARGLGNHWSIAATERLACDMVLAFGLVHPLVSDRHLNFEQIVEGLALCSKKWVLIDFVPVQAIPQEWANRFPWYSLDNFIKAIKQKFQQVSILPTHPESPVMLLCQK
jgi:hypothetical protein